ncbi:MAG: ABC transporter permease [Bacteroides sp.]|jgi:putative ABC transport system permease protein|nr:ABC transporter permease [Bacteroides sp.]MCI1682953.1 ABC transporter permease [Bacteroides sp.]
MKQLYYVVRTLLRARGSNTIKIISLSLGLTMSILLFSRVAFELSYDSCFKDTDNLYQVLSVFITGGEKNEAQEQNMGPVAGAILENFPKEVESATSLLYSDSPLYYGSVRFGNRSVAADSLFFQTMGIQLLQGNPRELINQDVIFLSDRLAKRIFGNDSPVGKVLMLNKELALTVKGTYSTLPDNTTLPCEAVISLPTILNRYHMNYSWNGGDSYFEYIRFRKGADKVTVEQRLDAMVAKYLPSSWAKENMGYQVQIKPLRDVYRSSKEVKRMVWIMSTLALAILFIASLNYVLISISSLSYRAKSIGVHKCNGASGKTIFGMFLWETGIIILLALMLMGLLIYNFRDFVEDTVVVSLSSLFAFNRLWVPALTVFVLFIIGGALPGRIFSSIPVTQVFRRYTEGKKGWKRSLLFVQFAGVTFITGVMCVVLSQYYYVIHKDVGYDAQRVVVSDTNFKTDEESEYAGTFFRKLPYVEAVSAAWYHPCVGYSGEIVNDDSGKSLFSTRIVGALEDYPEMMGMKIKVGKMAHSKDEVVVNECYADRMRWGNDIVGRVIRMGGKNYKVVGLMKDYRTNSFYEPQQPLVVHWQRTFGGCIHIRLKEPFVENLRKLNKDASEALSDKVVDFRSLEWILANNYNAVRVFRNATIMATVAMVFIMLMGLIGYTADEVRRRSKEIAIRKVNGAEVADVLHILSRDVLYVAFPAIVAGLLAAWYVNQIWMNAFAEQVDLSWAVYPLIGIILLAIIVGCVIWKSWRIANENPVNSIKSE